MICDHDTIAAPATAAGGALAVIRVSGGNALTICDRISGEARRWPMPGAIRFITAISWPTGERSTTCWSRYSGRPFLYGRRRRRNLVPRFAVHRHRNAAPADRRRRTHGPTGRIHHPGLSCGQTRPLAGRSRGRHHRLVLAGVARARRQPDARGLFRSVRHPARKTAAPHLAAGTRTRLLGRGGRIRRPHPAA